MPLLTAAQVAPASVLLNTPFPVAAYRRAGCCESIANAQTKAFWDYAGVKKCNKMLVL